MNAHTSERGQALILIILAIVGIFGFAALAVDGGNIYYERRQTQSAADAAAMAAAFASVQGEDVIAAGVAKAVENGFDDNGVTNTVTVNNPPIGGPYDGDPEYYQVIIWSHIDPIFAQFLGRNVQEVTTEAVAHAVPITAISTGNAVHCLDESADDCLEMDGTTGITINGGNMFANGGGIKHGHSGAVRVTGGEIDIHGTWRCTGCGASTVIPAATTGVAPQGIGDPPVPYCPTHDEYDAVNNVHYYYHTGLSSSATLQPGFHCFYGDISLTGGDLVTGNRVVLVMMSGGISVRGHAAMNLTRPNDIVDTKGDHYGGLLIYAPRSNTSTFTLGGTSDSWFTGTILAPGGTCDMGGNSTGNAMHTALICNKVKFHGTTGVNILYQEPEQYRMAPSIELAQ